MNKLDFWRSVWLLRVIVVAVVALFNRASDLISSLERKAYDLGVTTISRAPLDRIAGIRIHNQKLPAFVAAIVNKALAKNPDQRWQDGETMAKALRLCLQRLTVGVACPAVPAVPAAPTTSS